MTGKTKTSAATAAKTRLERCRSSTRRCVYSPHEIRKLRMLAQVIRHEAAAGDDLQSIGAYHLQRALHQFRGDAAAAQRARRLGIGDDDCVGREAIIRERYRA